MSTPYSRQFFVLEKLPVANNADPNAGGYIVPIPPLEEARRIRRFTSPLISTEAAPIRFANWAQCLTRSQDVSRFTDAVSSLEQYAAGCTAISGWSAWNQPAGKVGVADFRITGRIQHAMERTAKGEEE